jgi:hypothetical protein
MAASTVLAQEAMYYSATRDVPAAASMSHSPSNAGGSLEEWLDHSGQATLGMSGRHIRPGTLDRPTMVAEECPYLAGVSADSDLCGALECILGFLGQTTECG